MLRGALALLAVVSMTALVGCGDDEELTADEARYCELTQELEEIGGRVFADLPEDPSEEEFVAANRRFVEEADAELAELVEVAPSEIDDDVEAYVDHFHAQARGEDADVNDERIVEWEEEHCPE